MIKQLFQLMFVLVCTGTAAQTSNKIEAAKLVKITETSDFASLTKLTKSLSYIVLDSSKTGKGDLSYITREKKINGNVLGCSVDSKLKIHFLSFTTFSKETCDSLKKQLKALGFKSSGVIKNPEPGIFEGDEFAKGAIQISLALKKKDDSVTEYEFVFVKW